MTGLMYRGMMRLVVVAGMLVAFIAQQNHHLPSGFPVSEASPAQLLEILDHGHSHELDIVDSGDNAGCTSHDLVDHDHPPAILADREIMSRILYRCGWSRVELTARDIPPGQDIRPPIV